MATYTTHIIIDCDPGVDDALALFLLLNAHKYERLRVEAVTCTFGNTNIKNVVNNVFRVLELFENHNIPVHRGAYSPLLKSKGLSHSDQECFHGLDGFGDVYTNEPDTNKLRMAHAAYALNKYTSEYPGLVSIVCLGPLTNIALAIKLYPDFECNVRNLFIMGGNSTGLGNVTSHAEFNFYCDPESASIVLNSVRAPIHLLPWETCLKSRITHEWRANALGVINTPFVQMLNRIEDGCQRMREGRKTEFYVMCDAILAAIILRPEMITKVITRYADVELHGYKTRGQVVIDHQRVQKANVHIVDDFDSEMLKELLLFAVNPLGSSKSVLFPQVKHEETSPKSEDDSEKSFRLLCAKAIE